LSSTKAAAPLTFFVQFSISECLSLYISQKKWRTQRLRRSSNN
jgi:hypothetical protein